MNLSDHFTLAELTLSQHAARAGLDNTPSPNEIANLRMLCRTLEAVRAHLGVPLLISSGYRAAPVNRLLGGVATSAHVHGLAADFIAPAYGTPLEVATAIARVGIEFDQLINEHGRWVHIGLAPDGKPPRRQLLTKTSAGYTTGLTLA